MPSIRWALLEFVCLVYGVAATIQIALGTFTIIGNITDESLEAWAGASVGVRLIGAGFFALVVSMLAFIANAVAERERAGGRHPIHPVPRQKPPYTLLIRIPVPSYMTSLEHLVSTARTVRPTRVTQE